MTFCKKTTILKTPSEQKRVVANPGPAEGAKPTRIMIVDDSNFARRLIRGMLRSAGYEWVSEARDGLAAEWALSTHTPDIILLDWRMPRMGGAGFLTRLKQSPLRQIARIPVIVASGNVDHDMLYQAKALGAEAVIVKPFSVKVLDSHIQSVVSKTTHLRRTGTAVDVIAPPFEERPAPAAIDLGPAEHILI